MMETIPKIAYGLGTAWYKAKPGDINRELVEAVKTALRLGYVHLDNAEIYRNEEECGVALKESHTPRENIWLTTKLAVQADGPTDPVASLKTSLAKLQVSRVDLYLIHTPFFDPSYKSLKVGEGGGEGGGDETIESIWRGMEACRDQGLTRYIGVSNFAIPDLERVLRIAKPGDLFANQVECHPYNPSTQLHEFMRKNDIIGESYAPLAPLVHKPDGPLAGILPKLAEKYGRTEGQILLRWNMQKGSVVVTTSGKASRMTEQLQITSFELSDEDVAAIDREGGKIHYRKYFSPELDK